MNAGKLVIYRIYDLAHEVNFAEASGKLNKLGPTSKYTLKRPSKDFLYGDPPLVLSQGDVLFEGTKAQMITKIWSYGAVSFSLSIDCEAYSENDEDRTKLIQWFSFWCESEAIDHFLKTKIQELLSLLGNSLKKPEVWDQEEDYNIFLANPDYKPKDFWEKDNFVYQFLSKEENIPLSEAMISPIKESSLSYGPNDLVVIDWDSAFVLARTDSEDICDVIELANVQLLELRYFDDLLDKKLSGLYRQVVEKRPSIFNSTIALLARDASQLYLETSEVVERIENSLKVVGDIYFARLYRLSLKRLQVPQWQATVDQKLKNLQDVSQMYMGELHTRRGHFMEIIIIVLIAIEVVPFLYPIVMKYLELALSQL